MRLGEPILPELGNRPSQKSAQGNNKQENPQGVGYKPRRYQKPEGDKKNQSLPVEEVRDVAEAYVSPYASKFRQDARAHDCEGEERRGALNREGEINAEPSGDVDQEVAVRKAEKAQEQKERDEAGQCSSVKESVYAHFSSLP